MHHRIISALDKPWFLWKPGPDSLAAAVTVILMWLSFYTMYHTESIAVKVAVFGIFGNILVCVAFPVWWTVFFKKENIRSMGITAANWLPSLAVGAVLAFMSAGELLPLLKGFDWLPQVAFNLLILWEPFFIFGWLQARFEKDFGILPSLVLAGLGLSLYHLGSFSMAGVFELFLSGILFSAIYRTTKNILIMWPLYWCVNATVGTIKGNIDLDWTLVFFNVLMFSVQAAILLWGMRKNKAAGG